MVDCVELRRHAEPPASASAPRTVAAAPSFQRRACVCACAYIMEWVENCNKQVFVYRCRQVYTRRQMLSTLWNILVTILTSPHGVHMHSCMCIMFICTVQALYYMRVYHSVFQHLHVCLGGDWKWFFLQNVHSLYLLLAWRAMFRQWQR